MTTGDDNNRITKRRARMFAIEKRELYAVGDLSVVAEMHHDEDSSPDDYDGLDAETRASWGAGDWLYVGMVVTVRWRDREIGRDSLWGIEHGHLYGEMQADAWELTPADLSTPGVTVMGSALWSVLDEALRNARAFIASLSGAGDAVTAAQAKFKIQHQAETAERAAQL